MTTDPLASKDAAAAAEVLAALMIKDQDETICRYPTCRNPRRTETGAGRPSAYCGNPDHTALSNHRARANLKQLASGAVPEAITKREQPGTGTVPVESLRSSVLQAMTQLQNGLERYVSTLVEIADPDISAAQMQAIIDQATVRIADSQQAASTERSLRLAAESVSAAASKEAQAERETAETAIERMEEAEVRTQRIQEAAEQERIEVQTERDATVERITHEAQGQIEEAYRQAKHSVAEAEAATATAQHEARRAEERAHDAEVDARTRIEAAEQLVREANATLERERVEVDRLRGELATTIKEARQRAEAERAESATLLLRERSEVDRLRGELAASRARADQLATLSDDLRTQLVQRQKPI